MAAPPRRRDRRPGARSSVPVGWGATPAVGRRSPATATSRRRPAGCDGRRRRGRWRGTPWRTGRRARRRRGGACRRSGEEPAHQRVLHEGAGQERAGLDGGHVVHGCTFPHGHTPTAPSIPSRIRSAWPLCRAYSWIRWTSTRRSEYSSPDAPVDAGHVEGRRRALDAGGRARSRPATPRTPPPEPRRPRRTRPGSRPRATRPAGRPARRSPGGTRPAPPRPCAGPSRAASATTASSAGAGRRRTARRT